MAAIGGAIALVVNYRRQRHLERDLRLLNERFVAAASQLGGEHAPQRLAGVYALAALADEWQDQRQQCVDVLCGYLRLPLDDEPTPDGQCVPSRLPRYRRRPSMPRYAPKSGLAEVQVRRAIVSVIAQHLRSTASIRWSDLNLDFERAVLFDASFEAATFGGDRTSFVGVRFDGDTSFKGAVFAAQETSFLGSVFNGRISFESASFERRTCFDRSTFAGEEISFGEATFDGDRVTFGSVDFASRRTSFDDSKFMAEVVVFDDAVFSCEAGNASFDRATFSVSRRISFDRTRFACEYVSFNATFSVRTSFSETEFHCRTSFNRSVFKGEYVSFAQAIFDGSRASFNHVVVNSEKVFFHETKFRAQATSFDGLILKASRRASFDNAVFSGDAVSIGFLRIEGASPTFDSADFSARRTTFEVLAFRPQSRSAERLSASLAGARFKDPAAIAWGPLSLPNQPPVSL
ncbi:hypothetical protein [Kribbella sp. NPDC000426]|uniref:hypothetical protein n=1 Tax=Kribbella sp. NPDC000426 TaxID=3154255 RepID=UPI00333447D5